MLRWLLAAGQPAQHQYNTNRRLSESPSRPIYMHTPVLLTPSTRVLSIVRRTTVSRETAAYLGFLRGPVEVPMIAARNANASYLQIGDGPNIHFSSAVDTDHHHLKIRMDERVVDNQ